MFQLPKGWELDSSCIRTEDEADLLPSASGGFDKNKPLMGKLGKYKTRKARRRVNLPRGKAVLLPESG